ncbi:hypothetical protein [Ruania halotolerans]|uniref:hypothetical protein n=1 Tax=Ruania halotolerans TaxID=2897773 RepID=UPI001E548316|nr:hypothetical protein [Ruania halotolerans]UFU06853.1 hypothetical protein LQF10_01700 [Ruania halotolerans]
MPERTAENLENNSSTAGYDFGVRLNTGAPGSYAYDGIGPWQPQGRGLTLMVTLTDSHSFTFAANPGVAEILVRAGPSVQSLAGGMGDTRTITGAFAISRLTFCYRAPSVVRSTPRSGHHGRYWPVDKSGDQSELIMYHAVGRRCVGGRSTWTRIGRPAPHVSTLCG